MNLPETFCNIIEQAINGTFKYKTTDFLQKIPDAHRVFYKILNQLIHEATQVDQIRDIISSLEIRHVDFLLEHLVDYFEKKDSGELLHIERHCNRHVFLYHFYVELFNRIDVKRSDIHFLANIYVTFLGDIYLFSGASVIAKDLFADWSSKKRDEIKNNGELDKFLREYVLTKLRIVDPKLKHLLEKSLFMNIAAVNPLSCSKKLQNPCRKEPRRGEPSTPKILYCSRNFEKPQQETIKMLQNKGATNIVPKKKTIRKIKTSVNDKSTSQNSVGGKLLSNLPGKTIVKALSDDEYKELSVLQILAVLNSTYVLNNLKKGDDSNIFRSIITRTTYWVEKVPDISMNINKNIEVYCKAFLSLSYCWNFVRHGVFGVRPNRRVSAINTIFVRDNLNYLLEHNILPNIKTNHNGGSQIVKICYNTFSTNKLVDDDFILNILYCGLYKKIFSPTRSAHGFGNRNLGDLVWYYFDQDKYQVKLHGIQKKKHILNITGLSERVIRNEVCLAHFLSKFGFRKYHQKYIIGSTQKRRYESEDNVPFHLLAPLVRHTKPKKLQTFTLKLI